MFCKTALLSFLTFIICVEWVAALFTLSSFNCGPYGFICEGLNKLRLCDTESFHGPSFLCPANTRCNEDSSDVCESSMTYIDPDIYRTIRCSRNERIADPNVPDCKGYILCIPNKNRFQGIKFKCSGNTIFNGYSRTCTTSDKYRCPTPHTTTKSTTELYFGDNRRIDSYHPQSNIHNTKTPHRVKPIECKNYKFSVTDDNEPIRATYFCPPRPLKGERYVRCTVFSSKFCITLERDDEEQQVHSMGAPYRKPRMRYFNEKTAIGN